MGYLLAVGLGAVAGLFLLIVAGEVFYLFYWRKRPRAYPRGNCVTVAPVNEGEAVGAGERGATEVVIDVTCAEYQIAALHQDLVEKLFPAMGVTPTESAQSLMGPTRMLFTITEETKEDLEGLDLDGKGGLPRSRRCSRSKSMSDISLSPVAPLSPLSSTPFGTPLSSPDHFVTTPYGTPTYSPLVTLPRSLSSPVILKTSCRIMYDYSSCSPPPAPPSPTRPSFPFLARASSASKSVDFPPVSNSMQETSEWGSPNNSKLSPSNPFYSPPRKPYVFATPLHNNTKQVDNLGRANSPLRTCTYVYDNGTFSPSSPSSPQGFRGLLLTTPPNEHSGHEIQDNNSSASSSPHCSSSSSSNAASVTPFFIQCTPPSDTVVSSTSPGSSSCRPSSQRSSAVLFSSPPRPALSPVLADHTPSKYCLGTGGLSPPRGGTTLSSGWGERMSTPFIVDSSSSIAH